MDEHDRMIKQLDNIESKMDDFIGRVIRLEVKMNGFITIGTLILGAVVTAVIRLYIGGQNARINGRDNGLHGNARQVSK